MIISDEFKYVFVEVPKTASKSIARFLKENYKGYSFLSQHSITIPSYASDYFKFTCVRNPYVRMVSMWYSVTQRKPEDYGLENFRDLSFESFVEGITQGISGTREFFYLRQTDFSLNIDRILWYEKLPEGLLKLPFVNNVNSFPHLNSTQTEASYNPIKREPWKNYISQKILDMINDYYFLDFLTFNYQVCFSIEDLNEYEEEPWEFKL